MRGVADGELRKYIGLWFGIWEDCGGGNRYEYGGLGLGDGG